MKERYAQQPAEGFEINVAENVAIIAFRENVALVETSEDGEVWEADKYILATAYRDNLSADIGANYGVWLAAAKAAETPAYRPTLEEQVEVQAKAIEDLTWLLLGGGV